MQSVNVIIDKISRGASLTATEGRDLIRYIEILKSQRNELNALVHHRNREIVRLQEGGRS